MKNWFDNLWGDDTLVTDVKEEVLKYLKQIYVNYPPEFIYFKTLYHIFEQFLQEQDNDARLFAQTQITHTEIWKTLFEFQQDGAKGAIHKNNNYNGCILADSVGLGKTYTALAVIKYYELRNHRVLVLCPKRLRENWMVFLAQNNSEFNPFLQDRFAYTVLTGGFPAGGRQRGGRHGLKNCRRVTHTAHTHTQACPCIICANLRQSADN